MKNSIIFILLSLFIFWGCQRTQTTLTEEQKTAIIAEVESQMTGIQSTIHQLDIDAWTEYWSTYEFISVNSGINHFDDFKVWQDSVAYWWSKLESRVFESDEREVTPLTSDLALSTRIVHIKDVTKNGDLVKIKALVTVIWEKEADGWKIIDSHESFQTIHDEEEPEEE